MEVVKRMGAIFVVMAMILVACKEQPDTRGPDKPETPLKKVDDILTAVDPGAKPEVVDPVPPVGDNPEIPIAQPVPDKPGFVISPYNGKWIDVTGIKPGELMADPHFPAEEKKYFQVPEISLAPEVAPAEPEEGAPAEGESGGSEESEVEAPVDEASEGS